MTKRYSYTIRTNDAVINSLAVFTSEEKAYAKMGLAIDEILTCSIRPIQILKATVSEHYVED